MLTNFDKYDISVKQEIFVFVQFDSDFGFAFKRLFFYILFFDANPKSESDFTEQLF